MRKLIQCVQLSNEGVTAKDTVKAVKRAGFDGVFVQWYNDATSEYKTELVNFCRAQGLEITFAHLGYERINALWLNSSVGDDVIDGFIRDIKTLRDLGVDKVLVHVSSKENPPPYCEIGLERYAKLFEAAEKTGTRVIVENNKVKGYLEYIFSNTNYKNVGICLDVGHCHAHFKDDFNWNVLGGKIEEVHLHDNDGLSDLHFLPFDGSVPWQFYADRLKEVGYGGAVTLESRYYDKYLCESLEDFYAESYRRAERVRELFGK